MAIYYERIRKSLQEILNRIDADQRSGVVSTAVSQRTSNLYTYFAELLQARDNTFEKFGSLFDERVKVYGSLLSAMHLNIFNNRLQVSSIIINYLAQFIELLSSPEFIDYSKRAIYYSNNSSNGEEVPILTNYFNRTLSSVMDLIYEDVDYTFASNTLTISLDTPKVITKANLNEQEFIDKAIYLIAYLSVSGNYTNQSMNQYSNFFVGDARGSVTDLSLNKVKESTDNIKKIIDTVLHIDFVMENNDSNYSRDYIENILALYNSLGESLNNISDTSINGIKKLREIGEIQRLTAIILEIGSSSSQLVEDIIDSIKTMEKFLEDFIPFVPNESEYTEKILNSISAYENISYTSDLTGITLINPFSAVTLFDGEAGDGSESEIVAPITNWASKIIGTNIVDSDIYTLLIIIVGTILARDSGSVEIGGTLRDFALMSMIRKNYIDDTAEYSLTTSFVSKRDLERSLVREHNLAVVENYEEDIIPFVYKKYLPKLEVLDYMTFSEISDVGLEPDFREKIKTLILEAFAKEKRNFRSIMTSLIDNILSTKPETLKGLYMEMCFREVAKKFSDYLDGNTNGAVDSSTLSAIDGFVSNHDEVIAALESRKDDYLSVWTYFYDSANGLVEDALEDGDFKDLIS